MYFTKYGAIFKLHNYSQALECDGLPSPLLERVLERVSQAERISLIDREYKVVRLVGSATTKRRQAVALQS